ncbi:MULTISPECIES: hypothetical protein [unclassified Endozoicomonas]|uniref:hypothetical protein n=1 Tax=unclassified Endozoicomonas TaxID=2644528 RepID=UPI0021474C0D|nr:MULTISPECIES: hypothetical protein [unclassified Endozoicomonas]
MHYHWISQQGNERRINNDAALFIEREEYCFAMLVDGAQKGQPGNAFTQFILNHMVAGIVEIDSPSMPQSQTVITLLRALQKELRKKYLLNIASYLILLVPKGTAELKAQVIHCGDCRLGTRHNDGNIIWQTSVHTAANPEGLWFSESNCSKPERHILTRSLNARRFLTPDVRQLSCSDGTHWLLCTDGYWAEHLLAKKNWLELKDDASCLEISKQINFSTQNSDCQNLWVM